jgi:hypothetical protein
MLQMKRIPALVMVTTKHRDLIFSFYLDNKMHAGGISCDLAKAFDCVNH